MEIVKIPGVRWTAVHCRPRCEKKLAEYCRHWGIESYLPLRRRVKRYQRRNVVSLIPMFPGYLFMPLAEPQRLQVHQSLQTAAILTVDDASEELLIRELQEIQRLECASLEAEITVQPHIREGKPVRICGGPLAGMTGIVEKRANIVRVTVNVEILGHSASVDLDIGEVEVDE